VNSITVHDQSAPQYDKQTREYECYASDILFGLCLEYVRSGDHLLDIGIGTGLSAQPFARVGLKVSGVDGSAEMLKVCRAKGFARSLKTHDLRNLPLPYNDQSFHQVIACGVFHFFGDLAPAIGEAARLLRARGILGFTVVTPPEGLVTRDGETMDYVKIDTAWGVPVFAHRDAYVSGLLSSRGFQVLKQQRFFIGDDSPSRPRRLHTAFVTII
jgi:predicted TPR repeat methyltransferase